MALHSEATCAVRYERHHLSCANRNAVLCTLVDPSFNVREVDVRGNSGRTHSGVATLAAYELKRRHSYVELIRCAGPLPASEANGGRCFAR